MIDAKLILGTALAALILVAGTACPVGAEQDATSEIAVRLDEYLTRVTPFGFSGALLVAVGGDVILNEGYGLAIRSEGVPNSAETVFSTGSITKQFTAAAIMKLEGMGELSTDDPVSLHIDGVPDDKAGITLHHLLTHTAGVVVGTGPDYEEVGRDEVVARILAEPLGSRPGEEMSYSNAGYSLLAAVVERASGLPYEEFLRDHLFGPAGMERTGYRLPDWGGSTVAHWYRGEKDNGTPLEKPYPYWNLMGNGGILSTTGDMFAWYRALGGEQILTAAAKEKLFRPFLNDYACGWDVLETERGRLIQHDGGSALGNSAEFRWFVDEDVVIILFCNRSHGSSPLHQSVRDEIEVIVFGGEVEAPPPTLEWSADLAQDIEGNYRLATGGDLWVTVGDAEATISAVGQGGVNALFLMDAADAERYQDLNLRSGALVAAAVRGDSTVFANELPDPGVADRAQRFLMGWVRGLEDETGKPALMANAFGTVPGLEEGTVMTGVRLSNDVGESRELSFVWGNGRLVGFDQIVFDVRMAMAPVARDSFVAHHLATGRDLRVTFVRKDDGSVVGMTIGPPDAARSAVKRQAHEHGEGEHGEADLDPGGEEGEQGGHDREGDDD